MGLDMYLNGNEYNSTLKKKEDGSYEEVDRLLLEDKYPIESVEVRLGYWRKHGDLHGMIVETFADGVDECQPIALSKDDLRLIIDAVNEDRLVKDNRGFFFGNSEENGYYSEEEKTETIKSFKLAIEFLEGKECLDYRSITYQASW
tara:strand:+ start:40 stop:477 length:438 start_codon:yes stop_codon:yes gene_type:complete